MCAAGVTALLLAPAPTLPGGRLWFVMVASTAFVVMALVSGALRSAYGRWMFLGLIGCWLGDVLGFHVGFVAGALAFLVGHLFFIGGFLTAGISRRRLLVGLGVGMLASLAALVWLWPHLSQSDHALVVGYVAVITLMVSFGAGASMSPGGRLLLLGAVVFYVSDLFVARWKFVGGGFENALLCYPLYYTACLLLARSCAAWPVADLPGGDGE
jgi:uncharacterized membrane protein YhhN